MKLGFSRQISEKTEITSFIKIRPVGAELFHADGQTYGRMDGWKDMTKLTVSFRSFVNAPKYGSSLGLNTRKLWIMLYNTSLLIQGCLTDRQF
jgi:hypothetical protein